MEHINGFEAEQSQERLNKEVKAEERRTLFAELDEIENQIGAGIKEQGAIIRSRPDTDAQYARLDELALNETRLREREGQLLSKLRTLDSNP